MTTLVLESPAETLELTTIRFCGVNITLEDLEDEEFENLYDRVVDHGADLVEQAENWSASVWEQRKTRHQAALDQNSLNLELLEKEDNRRKGLAAAGVTTIAALSIEPQLCQDCSELTLPVDPNDLCTACIEVCNDFEQGRYIEPDWIAEARRIEPQTQLQPLLAA